MLATYAYDNLGRRTSLTAGNGTVTSWTYDPVGRLATLTEDLAGTANDLTVTDSYSPASQIAGQTRSNDAYAYTQAVDVNRGYTSNGLNQYSAAGPASFTYDANGNLTSDGTNTFTYDAENKLLSTSGAASTTLSYDPLNRLDTFNPGAAERFIYDGNEAVAELDSSGNIIGRFVRGDGADELLVSYPDSSTSNRRWVHLDERNSVIAQSDGSGNVTATNRYDEYGVPQSTNSGSFQYTGQMWLSQAGLQYSKARIYSPTLGRFLQTDPVGLVNDPNLYAYVLNDPVSMVDPAGLTAIVITAPHCPSGWACLPAGDLSLGQILNLGLPPNLDPRQLVGDDCTHSGAGPLCTVTITAKRKPAPKPTGSTPFYYNGVRFVPDPLYKDPTGCALHALRQNALGLGLDTLGFIANAAAAEYTVPAAIAGAALGAAGIGAGFAGHGGPGIQSLAVGSAYVGSKSAVAVGLSVGGRVAGQIGWAAWVTSTAIDVQSTINDFQKCRAAGG